MSEETKRNYLELLKHQRKYLAELNKDPALDEELFAQKPTRSTWKKNGSNCFNLPVIGVQMDVFLRPPGVCKSITL